MRTVRNYLFILFCLSFVFNAKATHNRAGEITYKWVGPGLYTYKIKITTYTNIGQPNLADRCFDTLYFGDGTSGVIARTNGNCTSSAACYSEGACDGFPITGNIKLNEYTTTHTYPGPGNYRMSMEDPNRNGGVINIPNSIGQVFYIESYLVIPTFSSGKNTSPILTYPPIDNGCVNKCFLHNPGAYDVDGDSISYELTTCRGENGITCPGYSYPATGGGTYNVNALTGTLTWCAPQLQGEYNLAMIIKEWRKDDDGQYFLIGYILRDLQVDVGVCSNNPPNIKPITDTCVLAGSIVTKTITATDPDGDNLTMEADGGPFGVTVPKATFSSVPGAPPVLGLFKWQTVCAHVRKAPYQVTIKVKDNRQTQSLVDFKTFNITVVPPPPLNLIATPLGTSIKLTWLASACQQTNGNKVERYCIYRKADCLPWVHSNCEVGVPGYTGFVNVGCTTDMNTLTFIDSNNGIGLSQGVNYSYLVVAVYSDNAESYASNQVCVQLKRDVPILVNVDIKATSVATGSLSVRWIKPFLGINALDTVGVTGPYEFRLLHHDGFSGTFTNIYSTSSPYFAGLNKLSDTTYNHLNINTQDNPHTYKVEFYANGIFVGSGQKASSVFLSLTPGDNKMILSWQHIVPWNNYKYYIFRKDPSQTTYTLKDSTTLLNYTDTGLVNNALYCYVVQSKGQYSDPTIYRPLLNNSQEVCAKPIDKTPPCAPKLEIVSDCKVPSVILKWNNPNHTCSDDVVKYNLYFAATDDIELALIDSIKTLNDTLLLFDNLSSIAGCYAITAVDSFGNESLQSAKICVDNCPEYELPNVITVNDDGVNDFFKAIKNKFVKDIDLKVYNRWGTLVYETTDPAFKWDGKVIQSKLLSTEGTYFYVCQVNEIRVSGIEKRFLKGFLQIFHK